MKEQKKTDGKSCEKRKFIVSLLTRICENSTIDRRFMNAKKWH
ncbi:hypothetical protein RUMHYD_00337 [Blautia hydrogenotrophica DSM 10507]|uniref:Uncharacterized protein n=1 Tax=Blautia hydrogenotrophica (strain DSM 10507 / JCM 14656 / S5a33) TaxID=476272 RepID=C0CHM3_BLAHS|nr:hypothetical protein RUMHYD_00337 [Blautia hydrogenotrophica DSM 10507]